MKTIGKYEIVEEPTDEILEEEILEDNVLGSAKNPYIIDEVTVRPYGFLVDRKHNMDYYLDPSIYNKRINIARALNSGYIDQSQIFGWNPSNMKYNPDLYGDRKNFRKTKRIARHNKRALNKAMKYAGSDQKSAADRKFYKDLGITMSAITASIPAIYLGTKALAGAVATAPQWAPWVATNVVLPALGGAIVDDATRRISYNYYNSFGDFVYRGTKINELTDGTWLETPTKFVADMTNPGYWAPYNKISKYAPKAGKFLSELNPWPLISSIYKDIGVVRPIKNVGSKIGNLKTVGFRSPVYVTEEVVAPVTSSGVVQTPEHFASSWGGKGGITKWYLSNIVLPNKIDSGIKYMTKNNDILKERLWKTYNRDLGISQYLEFFPPKQNGIVKDNTIMLIHGDPASTGVYTTASGIGRGISTIHHYPTMNNGKLYPTKDVYHDYFGLAQNKIFWGENKPHGWSLTKSFNTFIDDLKHIDHKILSSTDKKVLYSNPDMTTSEIPYRFIFGDAKKLNGIERNTPNITLGTEWITNDVNLKDLNGLEWNPFLGVWEKHIYQSGDHIINSELTDGIPIIWVDK